MTAFSYIELLGSVPMFSELDAAQLRTLYGFCSLKVLAKGEAAAVEGAGIEELGIVVSGRLSSVPGGDGATELGQGQSVEPRAFFTQRPAAATFTALRETVLLTLTWSDLVSAFHVSPDLLASCFSRLEAEAHFVSRPGKPARLVICPAGAEGSLDPQMQDALLSGFEALAEVRLLRRGSFGGSKPGAITLGTPETSHWLHEQELEFDLTVTVAEKSDPEFAMEAIEEADEVLFIGSGRGASLSPFERHALEMRGGDRCRLAVVKEKLSQDAAEWAAPRRYRSLQTLDFASPDGMRHLASNVLGRGVAVAATSRGVYAAAIFGALQAIEARALPAVALTAAGSAVLPAGLLASGAGPAEAEAIFLELANPAIWKRSPRAEAGLFEAAPIDSLLNAVLPVGDIAFFERPFAAVSLSLSADEPEVQARGRLFNAVRPGILPSGFLPPLVLENGSILVSGEDETGALWAQARKLSPSPLVFLYTEAPPLGASNTQYRQLSSASHFRLAPFSMQTAIDKRVRIETVLGTHGGARAFHGGHWSVAIPIPAGVTPMDWAQWASLREAAFEWMSTQLETRALNDSAEGAETDRDPTEMAASP